ncbi:hypothetical protein [Microvirga subterranea]|uniref:Uncharacterized protein n=1 Tax=Microvirga subterranea TaxID=186651 RepID=A0A370HF89_9HYPH|nr:hypothetical protein [Microvirga subterranea]RDI53854.1 hypothetical protein DES45_11258 [Microvirga subterranea]
MLRPLVALAFILSTSAFAQTYDRAEIIRGLCRQNGCDEFAILAASPVVKGGEGTLMQTRVKTFHASSSGRKELSEENGYVYCSPTKPAIVAEKGGRTMAFYLAPFATRESRETIRQNANFHALYFSICHGMEAGRAAVQNLAGVAQDLGYRVALPQSQSVALTRVEDILPPETRRPVDVRNDIRPRPPATMPPVTSQRYWAFDEKIDRFSEHHEVVPPRSQPDILQREEGLLAGPRRLTNRAFDALDEMGDWVLGRRY